MKKSILILLVYILMVGCKSSPSEPTPDIDQAQALFRVPENFPEPAYKIKSNPVNEAGFELGRRLFYDGKLSRDGTIACAECHSQTYAFTHHGHSISHGIDNLLGARNAPAVQNTAFKRAFFWDGGVFDLDLLSIAPITSPVEMDENLGKVLEKLRADPTYPAQFEKAFGSSEINTERFLKALSQFMNALISDNSKYDKYLRKEPGGTLTADELEGLKLFEQKCSTCHAGVLFTDESFRNNGLEYNFRDTDFGRMNVTGLETDKHKFKVPSLRNVGYTAPYMHDGRFSTLEEVLAHYSKNMVYSTTIDPVLVDGHLAGIPMTNTEQSKIILFLKTLNDESFIKNPKFAAPVAR